MSKQKPVKRIKPRDPYVKDMQFKKAGIIKSKRFKRIKNKEIKKMKEDSE